MPTIHYHHDSIDLTNGVYAVINDVTIKPSDPGLSELCDQTLQYVLEYSEDDLQNPIVQGYHDLVAQFTDKNLTHSGEGWVKLLRKREQFLSINTAVDAYNIVVAKSFLGFGAHDLDKLQGDITFGFAEEGDTILPVNCEKPAKAKSGDFVYRDEEKILAWLDVKDSDLAKIDLDTRNIILIIEGNQVTSKEYIWQHLEEACQLITQFCGGEYQLYLLANETEERCRTVSVEN